MLIVISILSILVGILSVYNYLKLQDMFKGLVFLLYKFPEIRAEIDLKDFLDDDIGFI